MSILKTPSEIEIEKKLNELNINATDQYKINLKYETEYQNANRIQLLDHLLSFLDSKNELNDVLAGYFSRVINLLIHKDSSFVKSKLFNLDYKLFV